MQLKKYLKKGYQVLRKTLLNPFKQKPKQYCNKNIPEAKYSDGSWLNIVVTPDQKRIEDYLENLAVKNKTILHVGTGNSSFATRFFKNNTIDSITVMEDELEHAKSLNLPNYHCFKLNKYSSDIKKLSNKYDFICDNNLSSFACCKTHFIEMMQNYTALLNENGQIITDVKGMAYHQDFAFPTSPEEIKQLFPNLDVEIANFTVILSKK